MPGASREGIRERKGNGKGNGSGKGWRDRKEPVPWEGSTTVANFYLCARNVLFSAMHLPTQADSKCLQGVR